MTYEQKAQVIADFAALNGLSCHPSKYAAGPYERIDAAYCFATIERARALVVKALNMVELLGAEVQVRPYEERPGEFYFAVTVVKFRESAFDALQESQAATLAGFAAVAGLGS